MSQVQVERNDFVALCSLVWAKWCAITCHLFLFASSSLHSEPNSNPLDPSRFPSQSPQSPLFPISSPISILPPRPSLHLCLSEPNWDATTEADLVTLTRLPQGSQKAPRVSLIHPKDQYYWHDATSTVQLALCKRAAHCEQC